MPLDALHLVLLLAQPAAVLFGVWLRGRVLRSTRPTVRSLVGLGGDALAMRAAECVREYEGKPLPPGSGDHKAAHVARRLRTEFPDAPAYLIRYEIERAVKAMRESA